ncbi:TolC family protein [Psychroflexus maritimus]|uniref:TolC family protein n=1 Tax=Psychroflexus maritimus TaxID=2714865 RepID=A0A967E261_9FLAO|nr:TolC family protein [Psychroflexus maritimus]NGZ89464.1 TolC family protein [Psychroflexus maritimus]
MKIKLVILLIFFTSIGFAQTATSISLEEFKNKIEQNNRSLQANEQEYLQMRAEYHETNAAFLPQLSASHTAYRTDNPVMAFGTLLNQGVFAESDFAVNNLNNPAAVSNFVTTFQVQQPLLNFDKWVMRSALKDRANAQMQQNTFKKEALLLQADRLYMQLQLAYKSLEVLEKSKATAKANLKSIEDFYEEGLLVKSDVLSAKVRLNEVENALTKAENELVSISDYMYFMMNEEGSMLTPENKLEIQLSEESQETSLANRSDVVAMDLSVEAYQKMKKSAGMMYLPTLNAFGNVQYFDQDVFGTGAQNFFVGATLNWNLFEGGSRIAKNQQMKAQLQQAKLEAEDYKANAEVELDKAKRNLIEAEQKMNRNTLSLEQAQEAFDIRKNRFEEGLERTTDLLNAEVQLANQELMYNQSIFEFNLAQLQVQFLGNVN